MGDLARARMDAFVNFAEEDRAMPIQLQLGTGGAKGTTTWWWSVKEVKADGQWSGWLRRRVARTAER